MVWTGHLTGHLTASSRCHCLEVSSGWIVGMHMTKNHYFSVTKNFLVIQNNSLSLECINKINKRKDGKQISTFDFSALIQFLIYVLLYVWLNVFVWLYVNVWHVSVLVCCPTYYGSCFMRGRRCLLNGQHLIPWVRVYRVDIL